MQEPNFIVRIPEPCHEDWNKMKPEEKGRFCNSCSKTVIDFSNKTDNEIKAILDENKNGHLCGHFKKSQIDRPLNYRIDLHNLPRNVNITRTFAIALFLVFGSILFSCTDKKNQKINVVGAIEPARQETVTMGEPMINQEIPTTYTIDEAVCAIEGNVSVLETHVNGGIGYEMVDKAVDSIVAPEVIAEAIPDKNNIMTLGMMVVQIEHPDTSNSDSTTLKHTLALGDNIISKRTDLSVYPNPSSGEFTIKYDVSKRADITINIYDLKGELVRNIINQPSQYEGKYQIPVNLKDMSSGIYIVSLTNGDKKFTEKVVIEQ